MLVPQPLGDQMIICGKGPLGTTGEWGWSLEVEKVSPGRETVYGAGENEEVGMLVKYMVTE